MYHKAIIRLCQALFLIFLFLAAMNPQGDFRKDEKGRLEG
jgi:hypothetical protein